MCVLTQLNIEEGMLMSFIIIWGCSGCFSSSSEGMFVVLYSTLLLKGHALST